MTITAAQTDDPMLLDRARGGDAAALEQLLSRHQDQIYRFSLRLCGDPHDAEDATQETMLAMARGVREFRGASSLSTWLYAIARSACARKHRGAIAAASTPDGDAAAHTVIDPRPLPDAAAAAREMDGALGAALAALEPIYRDVLILRDAEGLTAPEVAEVLGIGVPAVKSRLHRARLAVRDRLAPLVDGPTAPASPGCPDVLTLFSQHLEGEISADVCAEMERHLASCPRCEGVCDSLRRTLALCKRAGSDVQVPARVQHSIQRALQALVGEKS